MSDFRSTGKCGILFAGSGVAIDCVVADFISGAAETLSPANDEQHWDIIEGQGSLSHPAFAGVSLGLLHGSQPDAIVVCHDATRTAIDSCPHLSIPSIQDCIDLHLRCGLLTNPEIICVGISVNTSRLLEGERSAYLQALAEEIGLPCIDSVINGCGAIADSIQNHFQGIGAKPSKKLKSEAGQHA